MPGKFGGRLQSRHGKRPTSSRSLDSPLPSSNMTQASHQRPHSNQTLPHEESSLLRRHTTEELISYEREFPGSNASFVPRPPSRHSTGKMDSRPKSAKGRTRPSSQVGRESKLSRENLQCVGEQVTFPPPLKSQSSFSKYKPLPSIGTGPVVEPDSDQSSHDSLVKRTNNNDDDMLLKRTADMSIKYKLPDEPKDTEPERIHLAIKLLDGSRHERWFRHTDTLGMVLAFAESVSKDKLPPCLFCTNEVPRRVFNNFSVSLTQAGIISRTVLYLEDIV